jgi:membrane associated rhomboid family serine protease
MESISFCNLVVIAFTCGFSFLGFRNPAFVDRFIFWPEGILAGRQYYRLITSGFLHADVVHLGMNMVSLYLFGCDIEMAYGRLEFLGIYFAGIVGGDLLSLLIHRHHDYRSYGASGGVSGIVLASIFLFPGGTISIYFLPVGMPSWLYAVVFLGASFYGMKNQIGGVGHDAHLGGALVGLYTAAALNPAIIRESPKLFAVISVGTILLMFYLAKDSQFLPLGRIKIATSSDEDGLPKYLRNQRQLDAILAKISAKGIHSLTAQEQKLLRETSEKYRRRALTEKPKSGLTL